MTATKLWHAHWDHKAPISVMLIGTIAHPNVRETRDE